MTHAEQWVDYWKAPDTTCTQDPGSTSSRPSSRQSFSLIGCTRALASVHPKLGLRGNIKDQCKTVYHYTHHFPLSIYTILCHPLIAALVRWSLTPLFDCFLNFFCSCLHLDAPFHPCSSLIVFSCYFARTIHQQCITHAGLFFPATHHLPALVIFDIF